MSTIYLLLSFGSILTNRLSDDRIPEMISTYQGYLDTGIPKAVTETNSPKSFLDGKKIYCCDDGKTRYEVVKKGNKVTITSIFKGNRKSVHGVVKKGKIYSDSPNEKFDKSSAGKAYLLEGNLFRVKNFENGDYYDCPLCK